MTRIAWVALIAVTIFNASWLRTLYFVTGVAQLALVLALLGIVSWLPRIELTPGGQ